MTTKKSAVKKPNKAAIKKAQVAREARNAALSFAANERMPLVQDPEPVVKQKRERRPPPPNPTVLALQEQIVPLVNQREEAIRMVGQLEAQVAHLHSQLEFGRKKLQNVEAAIQYRLQLVAQIEGRPAETFIAGMPSPLLPMGSYPLEVSEPDWSASRPLALQPTSLSGISSIPSGRPPQLGVQAVGGDPRFPDARSESAEAERRAM